MSTHNIPFKYKKRKSASIIPNLQLWNFFKGLKNEFERAVVNEPSGFEPLKFYCIVKFQYSHRIQRHVYKPILV